MERIDCATKETFDFLETFLARFGDHKKLIELYEQDKYLNNIPIRHWDNAPRVYSIAKLKKLEGWNWSAPYNHVCLLKDAARVLIESYKNE